MIIQIPGRDAVDIQIVVFDYNGTLATDGEVPVEVRERIELLSQEYKIFVLTADTYGTAAKHLQDLPITLRTFPSGAAGPQKACITEELGGEHCACMGNGFNDIQMFKVCALSIAVIDTEGACANLISHADLVVNNICDGIDLLLRPSRIIAGLRY